MDLDIEIVRKLCQIENIEITMHAAKRLEQRDISILDIISCIKDGEIVEQYPDDYPFPSCLILGKSAKNALIHVVVGTDYRTLWIITAYVPDSNKWEPDLRTRKENES